ncbi:MAG: hypothetical protein R3324_11225 [Halobacteriales archaeon]|nr:hypothetical protein [Halobacteriales archaeon]
MKSRVFQLQSTLELPLEDLYEYFENDPDLPDGVEDVEITRRNNTLVLRAVAAEGSVDKYTPTAQLKATVSETRVIEGTRERAHRPSGPTWREDEEPETALIEVAGFKGDREAVLQNTALQFPMFEVLCDLAPLAMSGELTAIAVDDDELVARRFVDGEPRPAAVEVVEEHGSSGAAQTGVDWRSNKYISD